MTVVFTVTLGLLVVAATMVLIRLLRGPSTLDRILAVDVLLMLTVAGVAVEMAMSLRGANLALLAAVALLGFVSSVTGARLVEDKETHR
ncbi:MAG: sodium:proton antiporter [Pseudonocardiaceae bacterium]|nr:sodium:proton antiporter [Pseudonocardiaceae bacterium]